MHLNTFFDAMLSHLLKSVTQCCPPSGTIVLSSWWHWLTHSLKILACLLFADTVVSCQSVSQLSRSHQAQIFPHISYQKLKVCYGKHAVTGASGTKQEKFLFKNKFNIHLRLRGCECILKTIYFLIRADTFDFSLTALRCFGLWLW